MVRSAVIRWASVLLAAVFGPFQSVEAGCSGHCCPGTDLTCSSLDWRSDRVYGTCYCDESCARSKDCCFDYPTECSAQPCVVSEWTHWSGCARPCQPSYRIRRRSIEIKPQNSGQTCPALEERAGCMDYHNHEGRSCGQAQGPALITTMEYSNGRIAHVVYGTPVDSGFCMEFKVESLSRQCMVENKPYTRWMQYLREGFVVCVSCQPPAISNHNHTCQGDGHSANRGDILHWQAVGNPRCRGTWRKVQKLQLCSCPPVHSFIFI
ncbi:somatomedin-B and thrombospondin type-1 domain-containing protein [Salminus brasiliensis]|uniref:somatomedin-B and thrombospondin type-1 domain-containing protein n=1 Tax=Salminus brasiliensis TaxID=930266 RepID=UPI003B834946